MTDPQPILERMQNLIDTWEQHADQRAVFLNCYFQMTSNMLHASEMGEFHDPAWVTNLAIHFADYYFVALEAYEEGSRPTPLPWITTFDAAQNPELHVMQHLLLGINAHINYDLCFAIEDALRSEWHKLDATHRQQRYEDHCHVNQVIARTIDTVQDTVIERYAPAMDLVDRLLGRLDEEIITRLIRTWREEVWDHAIRLVEADPQTRPTYCQVIESKADSRARLMMGLKMPQILRDFF